jgi:Prenyltransferase and squalene oxidase repeat
MTWQLGASVVLLACLAFGFGWYERTRPDARVVALVATLAAFAALGRIAFAALPNVKPTTDIVLISGYALGAAPGFVVGAVAGLTSNFFFGQGPWTPWQMAAWGVTGLIGAGLAVGFGRRLGRWPLALACAVVGFGFTAAQDVGDWVTYSDHGTAQLGVYVAKGLGFDAVHAAGCMVFALAFGPALARTLERFASRLQVSWTPAAPLLLVALLAAVAMGAGPARAGSSPTAYLISAQNSDGGLGPGPGQASSQLFSGWAALGLEASGYAPQRVSRGGHSLLDYLRAGASGLSDPGSLERTILAVAGAVARPAAFGGRDLVGALERDIGPSGAVSGQTNLTAFAVLALRAAGGAAPRRSVAWLMRQQDRDGGFNFSTAGAVSDVDDTGAVLEALAGAGGAGTVRDHATGFIRSSQNRDGGFPSSPGTTSNAQSTAWAVQGLLAAGIDPDTLHRRGARSPLDYLRSLIASDGHVRYSRGSDQTPVWVTAQALMALERRALPLAPPVHARVRHAPPVRRSHRKAVHHVRPAARALVRRRRPAAVPAAATLRLATDAGILDALVLAPIGVT